MIAPQSGFKPPIAYGKDKLSCSDTVSFSEFSAYATIGKQENTNKTDIIMLITLKKQLFH